MSRRLNFGAGRPRFWVLNGESGFKPGHRNFGSRSISSDEENARPETAGERNDIAPGIDTAPRASLPGTIRLRPPAADDGAAVHRLIAACPPLDTNSLYCNLLQCSHFGGTCVLAERGGEVVGWISGYRPPQDPRQLFVWQVAVHPSARGIGLGGRMLAWLIERPDAADAAVLTTTITEANSASWGLFRGLARSLGAEVQSRPLFVRERHFDGAHDTEHLVSIGPLDAKNRAASTRNVAARAVEAVRAIKEEA